MPEKTSISSATTIKRRTFFGTTIAGIAGGVVLGNLFGFFLRVKRPAGSGIAHTRVTPGMDAVPRTGRGVR
jgi:hypothetical protein